MDDKKISDEKNAEEILADEQLDSVSGGAGIGTGSGYRILMPNENDNAVKKLPVGVQATSSGPG